MLYYLFRLFENLGIPGSGMWSYISFRSLMAFIFALIISAWFGEHFIKGMRGHHISETQRDVKIDPYGFLVIKDGVVRMINVTPPANNTVDRIIDLVPEVIDRVDAFISKQKEES